jgi:pimeloyl-CoA dehydrogenase small subunit
MDFELSDDQRLLKDTADRFFADRYPDLNHRRAAQAAPGGFDRRAWAALAELGLLAIPFAERHGGFGHGPVETMVVAEAIGRTLAVDPLIPVIVLAGGIIATADDPEIVGPLISGLADGSRIAAAALLERQSRYDLFDVTTTARRSADGSFVLEGSKAVALAADSADDLIVSARLSGGSRDRGGIGLFRIEAAADGVSRRGYPTTDGLRAADLTLAGVHVAHEDMLVGPDRGLAVLEAAVDRTIAALCAEAVGCMEALHRLTVDYLKTRTQFEVPISSFQVLQHRAVDMLIHLEQARSMALYAAMMADEPDVLQRACATSAAKVQIARSAQFIGETAIQLHGGIGMTMEYAAGHYFKRLTAIAMTFGDADHHLARLAELGGNDGA